MKIPKKPKTYAQKINEMDSDRFVELITKGFPQPKRYYHWDELRRRPAPKGISHEEWWLLEKMRRSQMGRATVIKDRNGKIFTYCLTDTILEALPEIDAQARGHIGIGENVLTADQRDRYVVSSLIEESITSSQLEGAVTTRKVAAEMLRSGRKPKDESEQMILNNFRAMQAIKELKDEPITPENVCELHRIVTEDTLDDEGSAGRFQTVEDERVEVWDDEDQQSLHRPPSAEELPARMEAMCNFANQKASDSTYLHPVLRAIMLHFWLAYDHPFEDGNGRTARALFYWSMLNQGYWLFEFVSISSLIRAAPKKYARGFLYSETDENDLTYFILNQLEVISKAIISLEEYIARKTEEVHKIDLHLKNSHLLNHRQKALIANALKNPNSVYSIESHRRSHNIAYATGRADLQRLEKLKLLTQFKAGKALKFRPARDIVDKTWDVP